MLRMVHSVLFTFPKTRNEKAKTEWEKGEDVAWIVSLLRNGELFFVKKTSHT